MPFAIAHELLDVALRKLAVLETKERPAVVPNNNPSRDPHPCLNHSQGWNAVDGARFQDQIGCGLWSSLARCPGCFRVRCLVEHTMGDTACEWGRWKMCQPFLIGAMMQDRGPIATEDWDANVSCTLEILSDCWSDWLSLWLESGNMWQLPPIRSFEG